MSDTLNYFAYGSNLHPERLRRRTPSCRVLGPATLSGYALRFHKRGLYCGSAKADAYYTGDPADQVQGVIYRITAEEKPALDAAEGLGMAYDLKWTELECAGAVLPVFFYTARPEHIDPNCRPFQWYRDLVLEGARHHDLAASYCTVVEQIRCLQDPDPARDAEHQAILATLRQPG